MCIRFVTDGIAFTLTALIVITSDFMSVSLFTRDTGVLQILYSPDGNWHNRIRE